MSSLPPELVQRIMCRIDRIRDLLSLGISCMAMRAICSRADTKAAWLAQQRPDDAVFLAVNQRQTSFYGVDVLRILLNVHGADVNQAHRRAVAVSPSGRVTPLMLSLVTSKRDVVEFLLTLPTVHVNQVYCRRYTALWGAIKERNTMGVALLLAHPDIDLSPQAGIEPALYQACREGAADIVRLLMDHPTVDPDAIYEGKSALHFACMMDEHEDCALALLDCQRVDINQRTGSHGTTTWGMTALDLACIYGKALVVRRLLHRPDLDMRTVPSALAHAGRNSNSNIINIIKGNRGGDRAARRAIRSSREIKF